MLSKSTVPIFNEEHDIVMHIAVLVRIAMADGKFLEPEQVFITNLANQYSSAYGTKSFDQMVDECVSKLPKDVVDEWMRNLASRPTAARHLVKDMISLGCVDGEFSASERELVVSHAKMLGVSGDVVASIERHLVSLITTLNALNELLSAK